MRRWSSMVASRIRSDPAFDKHGRVAFLAKPGVDYVRTLLGRVTTHWGSLAAGEAELTQVSSALVQPAAPEKKKKKGKKQPPAKRPPPFQLSITASLLIVEKKSSD